MISVIVEISDCPLIQWISVTGLLFVGNSSFLALKKACDLMKSVSYKKK